MSNQLVNNQITDAVTQANVKVVGEAPAVAIGNLYQTMAHSTGITLENAISAHQQQNALAQAATTQGAAQLYSMDTTAAAAAPKKGGVSDNLTSLLTVLNAFKGGNGQS